MLFYAKGGAAFAHFNYQMTQTDFAAFSVDFKGSRDVTGFVVGAGLEYALLPNLSLKAEYNYFDFGTNGYTLNCTSSPGCATPFFPASVRQNMQTVMLGVNWRFNICPRPARRAILIFVPKASAARRVRRAAANSRRGFDAVVPAPP